MPRDSKGHAVKFKLDVSSYMVMCFPQYFPINLTSQVLAIKGLPKIFIIQDLAILLITGLYVIGYCSKKKITVYVAKILEYDADQDKIMGSFMDSRPGWLGRSR